MSGPNIANVSPQDVDLPVLPPEAVDRLVAEITAGSAGRARRRIVPLTSVGVAAAVTAIIVVSSGSAPAPAWATTPTPAAPAVAAQAVDTCGASLLTIAEGAPADTMADPVGQEAVLAETRGTSAFAILVGQVSGVSYCLVLDRQSVLVASSPAAVPPQPTGDGVTVERNAGLGGAQNDEYVGLLGRAGPEVVGVDVVRSDGTVVGASVQNGWFAAWWPGGAAAVTLRITRTDGTVRTQPV